METSGSDFVSFTTENELREAIQNVDPQVWDVTISLAAAEELQELIGDFDDIYTLGERQEAQLDEIAIYVSDLLTSLNKTHKSYAAIKVLADMISQISLENEE